MPAQKYSVLMAVYQKDNPQWLNIAINSMVSQTLKPHEFVIVKDGPITAELQCVIDKYLKEYPDLFKIIKLNRNSGLGEALRMGVQHCTCTWIARMDADDYAWPNRCKEQFAAQQKYHADIIGCDTAEFMGSIDHVSAIKRFEEMDAEIRKFGRRRTPFSHPAVLMRREKILEAGNYRSAYLHEDYDLFVRMLMAGAVGHNVKENLLSVRVSEDFFARRGGIKYLTVLLKFNVHLLKIGWMKPTDFIIRSGGNVLTCLTPNSVRNAIYRKLLRN